MRSDSVPWVSDSVIEPPLHCFAMALKLLNRSKQLFYEGLGWSTASVLNETWLDHRIYYLRPLKHCQLVPWARERPRSLNWAVVVEYMDRAQGPTVDFFAQNLPVTLA